MDILQLESIVTTQLKARVPKTIIGYSGDTPITIIDRYPKISFTNEVSDKQADFPNVYIHELESSEVGNSIPNQTIHAIRDTIQIDVSTNANRSDARTVINACIRAMKVLRYSVTASPVYIKTNNIHRYVIRVRRVVANGDTF